MTDLDRELLNDDDADRLLAELGDALSAELTESHVEAAVNAFWVARTDALVAELEEHLDAEQRAGVRGGSAVCEHVYRLDALSVSLSVDKVDHRVDGRIDGDVISARWLDAAGRSRPLALDEHGRFCAAIEAGPASVEVELSDGRLVRTRWTLL